MMRIIHNPARSFSIVRQLFQGGLAVSHVMSQVEPTQAITPSPRSISRLHQRWPRPTLQSLTMLVATCVRSGKSRGI
eukprot:768635-Hanusia_phi.AAC.9